MEEQSQKNDKKNMMLSSKHLLNEEDEQRTRILPINKPTDESNTAATVVEISTEVPPQNTSTSNDISFDSKINNRFILKETLGVGGMGIVYRALDLRKEETGDLNPYVAIKLLSTDIEEHPNAFVSLQREAHKCQILAHPNIITVFDFDRDGDLVYLTMEELKGQPLDQLIRSYSQGLPLEMAINIITAIANGLAYAHKKKIVHADLKPANIFYTEKGEIKIIDFGIAKMVKDIDAGYSENPNDGNIDGLSPSYASIEMFQHKPVVPADDIYALGLISYELLTGKHPFNYDSAYQAKKARKKAKKISRIKRYQWAAIEQSLNFDRTLRPKEASVFSDKFTGKGRLVKNLSFSLALLSLTFASYLFLYDGTNTDYLYDELPEKQQRLYEELIEQGKQLSSFNDWNNALASYEKAYEILPQHTRTKKAVDDVINSLILALDRSSNGDVELTIRQVDQLLKYNSVKEHTLLLEYREQLLNKNIE